MGDTSDRPLDPRAFRAALDALLRQRDPEALRAFLVARGQWAPGTTTDPEAAMWMMIAASPALADLHAQAEEWLRTHGHAEAAAAILGRGRPAGTRPAPAARPRDGRRHRH